MAVNYQEIEGFCVRVDDVIYMPSLDAPQNKPHPFVYFMTIQNNSTKSVRILGRKWVLREQGGEVTVIEGDGVVGQSPMLDPGEDFSYNSYHITAKNAEVTGSFFGATVDGQKVRVTIPPFKLRVPDWA